MIIPIAERHTANATETMHATPERARVSTRYGLLDEVLRGEYPDSYAFLLSSPSCDERDLLLRWFLESEAEGGLTICLTRDFGKVTDLAVMYPDSFYVVVCHVPELVSGMRNVFQIPWYDDLFSVNIAVSSILQRAGPIYPVDGRRSSSSILSQMCC